MKQKEQKPHMKRKRTKLSKKISKLVTNIKKLFGIIQDNPQMYTCARCGYNPSDYDGCCMNGGLF